MIDRLADRALNRTARRSSPAVRPEIAAFHAGLPVVDLVVGSVLFRRRLDRPNGPGHLDLARARAGGLDLAGFTVATRFPDRRGTLSAPHFAALGVRPLGPPIDLAEALVHRLEGWATSSGGRLVLARDAADLEDVGRDEALRAFIGVQGGQVLGGDLRNVARLRRLGVRMLAVAHVMDSDLAGSGSGRRAAGLTGLGREAIAELETQGILVDLAHASAATIRQAVPRLRRPFVVSHTGFTALAGGTSRWRRYSPATRNLAAPEVRLVAEAGGLVGVTLATALVGDASLDAVVRSFAYALEALGPAGVALGSDFDGALPMPFDVTGLPALTQALLDAGFGRETVAAVMGGNALRLLRT